MHNNNHLKYNYNVDFAKKKQLKSALAIEPTDWNGLNRPNQQNTPVGWVIISDFWSFCFENSTVNVNIT